MTTIYAEPGRYIWAVRPRDATLENMLRYGQQLTPSPTGLYRLPWWRLLMLVGASNLANYAVVHQILLHYEGELEFGGELELEVFRVL